MSRRLYIAVALLALLGGAAFGFAWYRARPKLEAPAVEAPTVAPTEPRIPAAPAASATRWLAVGGGAGPDSNQLSLERDLALARDTFGASGRVLFAGGPGSDGVQVAERSGEGDPLIAELGDMFAPRAGRDASYRRTTLDAHGPATLARLKKELAALTTAGSAPLIVYFASHGDAGSEPAKNVVSLWGGSTLAADELASLLDDSKRPVRLVVAACFSGGFAEIVFRAGRKERGAAPGDRCGLFSSTWDLEASGCDPDPDRRTHESYALHFLNALRGRDRSGAPLARDKIDFDGDGKITLAEAHARVRIASRGIEVPTTTSERWLRETAPSRGGRALEWPEEEAVIAALAKRLHLEAKEDRARDELESLEKRFDELSDAQDRASDEEQRAYQAAAGELLARWPALDDPWHPDFASTIASNRRAIRQHLDENAAYRRFREAGEEADRIGGQVHELMARRAPYERLVRALDNRLLAARLHSKGGRDWKRFLELLACERSLAP